MYTNGYTTPDSLISTNTNDFWSDLTNVGAGLFIFFVFLGLIALTVAIFLIIAECKVYKKAGEAWWKALIPVYSTWVEAKISGLAWWWCPIFLGVAALSGLNNVYYASGFALLVISFNFNYNLSKKFGKSNGFAVLLTLLPIIGLPILAFGSSKYDASAKTDINGIFAVENHIAK